MFKKEKSTPIQDLLEIFLEQKKLITDEDLKTAAKKIFELSVSDLKTLFQLLKSQPIIGTDTAFLTGVVIGRLKENNIDLEKVEEIDIEKVIDLLNLVRFEKKISSTGPKFRFAVLETDLGVRSREEFRLPESVSGYYYRRIKKQNELIKVEIVAIKVTFRFGLPPFVSSLVAYVDDETKNKYNLRSNYLTISERSFRASEEKWSRLFELIQSVLKENFGFSTIVIRRPFSELLLKGELFETSIKSEKKKLILRMPISSVKKTKTKTKST